MGLADEIINGTYQYTSQKKKKKNVADEIINGNYQYKAEKTRQEQQEQEKQVVHQLLKGVGNNFNPIEKTGEVVSTVADKGGDLINYFASGKAQKDATQAAKNTGRFLTDMDYREKVGLDTLLSVGTGLNIAAKTVSSQVESGAKFLYNESTKATNWLNNQLGLMSDEQYQKAEQFRKDFMKENTTEKIWKNVFGWDNEVNDFVKKNSFITEDNFGGQTVQGLTQLMTTAAMGQTGFGWELPTFISSAGGAEQKAYQLGANDTQALAVGLFGGTLEVLTEKLGSGVVKVKGTGWKSFERLEDDLTNKISNNVVRYLAQTGVSAMNEGMEEVISGYGNAIAEKLTYMSDKDLKELYSSKDAFQDFMMAAWTSLLAGGARSLTPSGGQQLREDIRSGRSQITGFTQNEQNIIDSEVAQRIQEAKEKGQKVSTYEAGKIVEQVQEDLRNGDLSVESIQRGINGEKYQTFAENETKLKETQSQLEEVEKNLKDNYSSKVSKLNPEYEQLLQQQKDLSEQINVLKNNQQALGRESYLEARELSQNDALAQRSLYEYEQGGRHFEYKLDDNASDRTKGLYESAAQNGNNTTKFRNFVKGLDTLQNNTDKSYQYRFTNTEELREKGLLGKVNYDVQEGDTLESIAKKHNMSVDELKSINKNLELKPGNQIKVYAMSNGLKAGNTIYLNIDTNDSLETVLGHEVTHLLEGTDDYKTLRDLLYKQAKKNGIYDSKRAELEDLYAAENADIDSELTAELAKELFTDENFINELTTKPNTFKKVLNFIDDLITKFTGSSEEVELRKIKKQFQEAFNNMKSYDESNKVQHSLGEQVAPFNNVQYSLNKDNYTEEEYNNIKKQIPKYSGMTKEQLGREYGYASDSYQEMVKLSNDLQKEYKEYQKTDEFMNALQNYDFDSEAWLKGDEYADKIRYYNREADKYFAQREAINSILMDSDTDTRSSKQIVKDAEKHFGITNDFKETAYITTNGNQLDFSGFHEGGTKGSRSLDHRQINEIDTDMDTFIAQGNIRVLPESGGINLEIEPNAKQYAALRDYIEYAKQNNDEIYVDVVTQNGSYDSIRYNKNTQASKIINDIKSYFENGSFPQQSRYADFLQYSISKDSKGRELSEGQQKYFKDSKVRDNEGRLLEVYHGTPNPGFTVFDTNRSSSNTMSGEYGLYFTDSKQFADDFSYERLESDSMFYDKKGKKGDVYSNYLNITNPLDFANLTQEQIEDLYNYASNMGQLDGKDAFVKNMLRWQEIGNHQLMKGNLDLKAIADNSPYDGIKAKLSVQGNENEYIVFNSNQIKNVDNTDPTTNDDIRYSMSNNIAPIRQRGLTYDVGVRQEQSPELIDIAPINERIDEARQLRLDYDSEVKALEELDNTIGLDKADSDRLEYLKSLTQTTNESTGQEYTNEYSPFEKAKKNLAENKVKRFIEKETYKAIDKAAKVAAQYGEFNRKEKTNLRNEFKRFSNLTSEQLTNPNTYNEFKDIIRQYADREMNFTDYHLKEVRDDIRKRKINVSDIRNQITDFNDYRKQYFGRLNLTNEGMTIDQHYQELSELYPEYFSKDITTEADMLNQLMDFMDLDTTITEKYRLSDDEIDRITSKAFSTLVTESPTEQQIQEYEEEINRSVERKRSEVRRQQLLDEMGLTIDDIAVGKDINALGYQRTDPIRLNEKVFGYEVGKKINDATIRQTIHNTAEKMRWQDQRSEIEDLGIKARSKESAAVQKYGEGEYVNDLGELVKYGDKELASEFPNIEIQNKIKRAAEVLRGKYDTYIDQINDVLTDLGYDAIPKRKNYFRHFIELNDKFSQWGTPFNRQTMQEQDLPTDINGLTDQFKPGKQYFASALERKGIKTTYDAITGIDGYIETAGNLIFHTEDIQRYRALSKLIRETYGQTHGFDNIDIMTEAEKNQRVEDVYGNKLTKYAAWLDEQANALAGKKAGIDRAVERMLGRKVYTAASTLKSQVGSNMTGFNVRSAMTNFASVVQGASKTSKIALLKGTVSTIQNMIHDDGMAQKSDFLTGRYGTNQLSQKAWQKIANAGQIFMEASDHFTSNQIWRSKYYELLDRGMSETEAIREADDFAARVMGNRVQGSTAEIFNSKTLGFLTQFQLEVNNQWSNMIHDNKMELQSGKKGAASVVFQLGQLYGLSYMFNTIMKGLTGSDVMFDPIDLLMKLFNPDDDDDKTTEERARDVLGDIVNQLPMASIFTGGRIPIQEAFSGVSTGFKYLTGQENEYGQKYTAGDVFDDSLESLAYLLLPTGYGQLRKTYKGTIDTDYDVNLNPFEGEIGITKRPVRGSYTDSGNLRFTADNDIPGKIRSALFGQYANSEAQDYINSGYQTINAKKIPELQEFEMTSSEYKKWQKEYSAATSTTEEIDGVKYTKYKDSDGNIYLYDKNTRTLLDSNGNKSNKNVTTMSKVDKKELVYDYIKNSDFTPEQKEYLFDENFDNTTTDKYGYEKYTERTTDKNGKPVTKTYWYDSDNNTLYDSKYKVSNKDINSLTKVSSDKSVEGYNSFDTYEEFDYSYKNPDKYKLIQDTGSYKKYKTNETYKNAVDWAYKTPSNYSMSKALDGIENTYTYLDELNNIKGDKDKKGKTISGSRKTKVFNYINSLNLTPVQKAMLVRTQYSSYDNYNNEIVNYLNNQTSITLDEEYEILKKLGYKVKGDRVSW